MHPAVRIIGKVLRLVGISSPEDAKPRVKNAGDPPSWRSGVGKVNEAESWIGAKKKGGNSG